MTNRDHTSLENLFKTTTGFGSCLEDGPAISCQRAVVSSNSRHLWAMTGRLHDQLDAWEDCHHQLHAQLHLVQDTWQAKEEINALEAKYYLSKNGHRCLASECQDEGGPKRGRASHNCEVFPTFGVNMRKMRKMKTLAFNHSFIVVSVVHVVPE